MSADKSKKTIRRAVRAPSADEKLRSFATARETAGTDTEIAVAEALSAVTDGVSVAVEPNGPATFFPADLFQLRFSSPEVGVDERLMPSFLQNLALAFDSHTGTRVLHEIAPAATDRIGSVSELIRLWLASPKE